MTERVTVGRKPGVWSRIKQFASTDLRLLLGGGVGGARRPDLEALERTLLEADLGVATTADLVDAAEDAVRRGQVRTEEDLRRVLEERLTLELRAPGDPGMLARAPSGPTVVLFVGVNGVGKTTTLAKLGRRLLDQGHRVLFAAADTYRAAAAAQLQVWAERLGVACVAGAPGGDPAAVAFDAVEAARSREVDFVLVDTAGRLHTNEDLMQELSKVARVIGRRAPGGPHETLLVLDGTVGQNAVSQGLLFTRAVPVTGLIVTKLDGTARGGVVVALRRALQHPIRFLGRGETLGDLEVFDPSAFARELMS
jgi:fused signal recognition particle receptor